ncbi:putative bifunctional diguanylate cyclase/phosphodiesterase [Aquipuribacter nitratireducens]|uniref:Bifunctional diguanylate cyclase/phosphodiesterase n=1 Tax=Aquipuribacter nitratireducens TaxID=650104 RepID=A0ABW0GTW5_9MICO
MSETAGRDVLAAVLDALPANAAVLDRDGRIAAVNVSWRGFCVANDGEEAACGVGADYLAVCRRAEGSCEEEAGAVADGIEAVLAGGAPSYSRDYDCSSPEEERWFQLTVVPLHLPDDAGGTSTGALVTHLDITARKLDEVALAHAAGHDPLTGLPNRAVLLPELRRALHRAHEAGGSVAVVYFDLDGFKAVNDTFGHQAGDGLLRTLALRLQNLRRPEDLLARLGGDEFVAVMPGSGVPEARRLARRAAAAVRRPVTIDGLPVSVTVSCGIALATGPDTALQPEDLLADADAAMYRAKRLGSRRAEVASHDLRTRAGQRAEVESELEAALAGGGLQLFRQGVVSLEDGSGSQGEALLRWFTTDGGLRTPDTFLGRSAHPRIARRVTRAVLVSAIRRVVPERGEEIAVNIGLADLRDPRLPWTVEELLARYGCPPEALTLEIAEEAVLHEPARARGLLGALRGLGVRGVLDDFGSGTTSLDLLASLPIDGVKIDRGLVSGLERRGAAATVQAVTVAAHDLGLRCSACGVQTEVQRRRLLELGVSSGQGWLLGPPQPWTTVDHRSV